MTIESELLALKNKDGLFVVEDIAAWAKTNPNSALYNAPEYMGWDEKKLAYEQILHVTRRLIAIHIVRETGVRRFISLTPDRSRPGGGYRDVYDILKDRSLYEIMLNDALNELERIKNKYENLKELEPVWETIGKIKRGRRQSSDEKQRRSKQA